MTDKTRQQQIEALLAEDPDDPFLRYGLAMEYVGQHDDATAVRYFRELIAASPDYVPAHQQIGQALARLERVAEARAAFTQGVAVARRAGEQHAADEMQGFLDGLG